MRNAVTHRYLNATLALALLLIASITAAGAQQAKNVIIMISDGWGYNHILATNYYTTGQARVQPYESFNIRYPMSTYSLSGSGYDGEAAQQSFVYVTKGYTDSAAAATALSTGVKTVNGALGLGKDGSRLTHVMEYAEELGKSTGVVTTVEISHATPAGFVAHNTSRKNLAEIAQEMVVESNTDVIIGACHPWFDDNGQRRETPDYKYVGGQELWDTLVDGTCSPAAGKWTLVQSRDEFCAVAGSDTPPSRLLGVCQTATTTQQARRGGWEAPFAVPQNANVPTLAEMSSAALNVLGQDTDGFVLMIEGGAVDWANHANQTGRMIEEMIDFNVAVEEVIGWIKGHGGWKSNLLIVTGDHECGYLNGPANEFGDAGKVQNRGAGSVPGVGWYSVEHTNSLIPVFAEGDAAELFHKYVDEYDPVRGYYVDNTEVAKVMFEAIKPQP